MDYPKRKHARYRWHDYNGGLYFITICTKDKQHFFGYISNDEIIYSEIGMITAQKIDEINSHWNGVKVIESVVMPNHVHLIIQIAGEYYQSTVHRTLCVQSNVKPATATPRRGPTN